MARLPRFVLPGSPHHVVQRGHNRQPIVTDDEDRRMWLALLREAALAQRVDVHAWALLDDRFHLIVTPPSAAALSRLTQTLGRRYVAWFNRCHGRTGTLWEGRFRAAALEPSRWLLASMCYVEVQAALAPPVSGAVAHSSDTVWSSLAHHTGQRVDTLVTDHPAYWALGNTPFERHAAYGHLLEAGLSSEDIQRIGAATQRGWPLGLPVLSGTAGAGMPQIPAQRPRGRPRKHTLTFVE